MHVHPGLEVRCHTWAVTGFDGSGRSDALGGRTTDASVSICEGVSSPLHVRLLARSVRTMKTYEALIGASNQPCH